MAKKKIKDITLFDLRTMCRKHFDCNSCPMIQNGVNICGAFSALHDEDLNKEVEVDEKEN